MYIITWYKHIKQTLQSKRIYNLDATLSYLLSHVLKKSSTEISLALLESEQQSSLQLASDQLKQLNFYTTELSKGKALSNILYSSFFCDLEFYINKNVLCPRQATQALVYEAHDIARGKSIINQSNQKLKILDLGTGSGCISVSLANILANSNIPADVYAIDVSTKALQIAKYNATKILSGQYTIHENLNTITDYHAMQTSANHFYLLKSNWFSVFKNTNIYFDIIISNPPYIAHNEYIHKSAKFDPKIALYANEQGFANYKHILKYANRYSHQDTRIIFEIPTKFTHKLPACKLVQIAQNLSMTVI